MLSASRPIGAGSSVGIGRGAAGTFRGAAGSGRYWVLPAFDAAGVSALLADGEVRFQDPDGAPRMTVRAKLPTLSRTQMKSLQQELARRGYDLGKIDGVLGLQTRLAVREAQKKAGMPADGWPTAELLAKLRAPAR